MQYHTAPGDGTVKLHKYKVAVKMIEPLDIP